MGFKLKHSRGMLQITDGYLVLGKSSTPVAPSISDGYLYVGDDGGDAELFFMDDLGAVTQITKDGAINAAAIATHNTLDQAYDESGAGLGREVTADAGPVFIDAAGDQALDLDGYLSVSDGILAGAFSFAGTEDFRFADGAVLMDGTVGATPVSGAGTRLMWIPEKGAFRAGTVSTTQWDDGSVGDNSVAFGLNTIASGDRAAAFGSGATASGNDSFATSGCTASGATSVAIGISSTASIIRSIAIGRDTVAAAEHSIALGLESTTNRRSQLAFASGEFSSVGDAQTSQMVFRASTTDETPTEMFAGRVGTEVRAILENDHTYFFTIQLVARRTDADDEGMAVEFKFAMDRNTGDATTALIGSRMRTIVADDSSGVWDVDVSADTTNGSMKIEVTGESGKTIRWVAFVRFTETSV